MTDEVDPPLPTDAEAEQPKFDPNEKLSNVSPLTRTIAERLRTARLARSMTQQELAGTQFSNSYISALEHGRMTPSLNALALLAQRLAVSLAYLIGEGEADWHQLKHDTHLSGLLRGPHSQRDYEAIQQMLNQAKACLRTGNWREALQVLGERETPPGHLIEVQLIDWYWLTGWALVQKQRPDDAIRRLQEGLRLAEQSRGLLHSSQRERLAESAVWLIHFLGSAWCAKGQTALAYDYHKQCRQSILDGTVTDPELRLLIYSGLGRDALVLGRTEESISAYKDAVRQAADQRNPRQRGFAFWGLGLAYQAKEDFLRAKASYRQALEALNRHEDIRLLAQVRNLLGHVLFHLGEWKQAERQFRFSLDVVRSLGDYNTWGYILSNLAELYGAQGHWEDSIEAARAGVLIAQKSGDARNHGQLHLRLASAYAARHDVTATEEALQKAMAIFEEIADLGLLGETRARYAEFLQQQGRFQDAYECMRLELVFLRGKKQQ